jgi:hypothetical protein
MSIKPCSIPSVGVGVTVGVWAKAGKNKDVSQAGRKKPVNIKFRFIKRRWIS